MFLVIVVILHFCILKDNLHVSLHSVNLSISLCRAKQSSVERFRRRHLASSANSARVLESEIELGMSLINTKNGRRPMIDPWGTLDKLAKDDRSSGLRYTEQKNLLNSSAFSKGLGTFS